VKSTAIVFALVGALTLTLAAQQKSTPQQKPATQTAEAALGAAIHLEEVERNLDAAIAAYKVFLSQYGSNRPLAARAQYRLGLAYEKRGDAQARQAFERVGRDFPEQKDVVADANFRLAALTVRPTGEPTVRLVLAGGGDLSMLGTAVSLDGRWLARRNPSLDDGDPSNNDGSLVVTELASGRVTRLQTGTCLEGSKGCYAERPAFSPDGRQLVYAWRDQLSENTELRVIANEPGAKFRTLIRDRQVSIRPSDWSRDGRAILAIKEGENEELIRGEAGFVLVSVTDGRYRIVKSSIGTGRAGSSPTPRRPVGRMGLPSASKRKSGWSQRTAQAKCS
jgi:hypothetical protein